MQSLRITLNYSKAIINARTSKGRAGGSNVNSLVVRGLNIVATEEVCPVTEWNGILVACFPDIKELNNNL